jgi:hypothetical protein
MVQTVIEFWVQMLRVQILVHRYKILDCLQIKQSANDN